ncbi:exosortase F system-associated membrane protein [Flavobacterium sp. 3HN19-14]|uniref:exosortase F system-associated membrane protein n=1 Tax=Flavobacterium sp. 3HN19-14 TaxID=3448133 RepID=UPI003EDEBAE1
MLKKLLNHKLQVVAFVMLVALLAVIRNFEETLFYDPFLNFFRIEYENLPLPEFDVSRLIGSLLFRYFLNTIVSLGIIYTVFKDLDLVKFSAVLYAIFFILLIIAFFAIIHFSGADNNLVLFYVRRFLIQPLLVILFVPAFYYQNRMAKK